MSDESEKPRKIRDIRERLGRTTQAPEPPADGVVPPPASVGGVAPPPNFVGSPGGGRRDPFVQTATAGPAERKEVRIVVDDEAVATAQRGSDERARRMLLIWAGAASLIGLLLGILAANMILSRRAYNVAVRDGKALYERVLKSSDQVAQAKQLLDKAASAAKDVPGATPTVDYGAIDQLRSLPEPFSAADFAGMQFMEFTPETVSALFAYTRAVGDLWERFDRLGSRVLPDARRAELDEAAKDASAVTNTPTGCIPTRGAGGLRCGLVFVDLTDESAGANKVKVRATRGSRPVEKQLYAGQDLRGNSSQYVILTNPEQSSGVLGRQRNAFSEYRKDLAALNKLMGRTQQIQGELEKGLGDVATLDELLTL